MQTILIVDDSRFQHSVLKKTLSSESYELLFASNGKEALEMLAEHPVDGIIADLIMPEMRGKTFLTLLAERGSRIPVIVLTADIQEHVREECLKLGAKAVLHKPARQDLLHETLRQVLEEASS